MPDERYENGRRVYAEMIGEERAAASSAAMRDLHPVFEEQVMAYVMNDLYARPGLDVKTRLLCTIAALTVTGRQAQLRVHYERALGCGATVEEIEEVVLQMAAFGGFPATWDALQTLREHTGDEGDAA